MIKCILGIWYAHLRKIDVDILWPVCRDNSPNLDTAKAVFAIHVLNDEAWLILGEDEIYHQIDLLH
jgi:hypothetical protein